MTTSGSALASQVLALHLTGDWRQLDTAAGLSQQQTMVSCKATSTGSGALLLSLLFCLVLYSSHLQVSAGRGLLSALKPRSGVPSMFSVSLANKAGGRGHIMLEGEEPLGANTIPKGDRTLELEDAVLDSEQPEVSLPLLEDLEVVVVWDHDKQRGKISELRSQIDDQQALLQPNERVTLTGTLKGYEKGETMVNFVVSVDSFFGLILLPWEHSNGDVVTRYFQIESFPGEAHIGASYESFKPDLPINDVVVEPTVMETDGMGSDVPESDDTDSTVSEADGKDSIVSESDDSDSTVSEADTDSTVSEADTDNTVSESDPDVQQDAAAAFIPLSMPAVAVDNPSIPKKPKHDRRKLQQSTLTRVDILILYTAAASRAMGGDSASVNKISSMITTANQIYANSKINMRLNLVAAERVTYIEDPRKPTSLDDLFEGKVPGALAMREQYGADIVQMVTVDQAYCGIGYKPLVGRLNSRYALSVVQTQCMGTTAAHEIGHNFGCNHDYYSNNRRDKYNGLSRCDIPSKDRFRTVLSYGCEDGSSPQELFYISNPDVTVMRGSSTYSVGDARTANCSCSSPNVCASFGGLDVCCSSDYPTWCGGETCYRSNYQCPTSSGREYCPGGGFCTGSTVCSSWGNQDTCCSSDYPVWCGSDTCYRSGTTCPSNTRQYCKSGSYCSASRVCAYAGRYETCCPADFPTWCGGNSCLRQGTSCRGRLLSELLAGDDSATPVPATPVSVKVAYDAAPGQMTDDSTDVSLASPVFHNSEDVTVDVQAAVAGAKKDAPKDLFVEVSMGVSPVIVKEE
eukprot:gene19319-25971_t